MHSYVDRINFLAEDLLSNIHKISKKQTFKITLVGFLRMHSKNTTKVILKVESDKKV